MSTQTNPFAFASGRLLVNSREIRILEGIGAFCIAWIARAINLGLVPVKRLSCTQAELTGMSAGVMPRPYDGGQLPFSPLMLHTPLLACEDPDGSMWLLDGRKRAHQAFSGGDRDVPVAVVSLADAKQHGMISRTRKRWKIAERTRLHPINAERHDQYQLALVQLASLATVRGRPKLTDVQKRLDAIMYFYIIHLIEMEYFIRQFHKTLCLVKGGLNIKKKVNWEVWFFDRLREQNELFSFLSYASIRNAAPAAIKEITRFTGRPEYRQYMHQQWKKLSLAEFKIDRDSTVMICIAVVKAAFRLTTWQETQRSLVKREHENTAISDDEIREAVDHRSSAPHPRDKHFIMTATEQDLGQQLMVTNVTGVNINDFYIDGTSLDPLFEAYVAYHAFKRGGCVAIDLGFIETIVQRRNMAIERQDDNLSTSWNAVIDLWFEAGLGDDVILYLHDLCDKMQATRTAVLIGDAKVLLKHRFEEGAVCLVI